MSEREFLESELQRKLYDLGASETERKIALARFDLKYEMLVNDIDKIQKRLNKINESKRKSLL